MCWPTAEWLILEDWDFRAERGPIDKFIGDAAMATWGSLSESDDQADSAVRAAPAIVRTVKADNDARRRTGKHSIRIRLGIHTGAVLVGNIGAPTAFDTGFCCHCSWKLARATACGKPTPRHLAAPTDLTISKVRLRTRASRIL